MAANLCKTHLDTRMSVCHHELAEQDADDSAVTCECGEARQRFCVMCKAPDPAEQCAACGPAGRLCNTCWISAPRLPRTNAALCDVCATKNKIQYKHWSLRVHLFERDEDHRETAQFFLAPALFESFEAATESARAYLRQCLHAFGGRDVLLDEFALPDSGAGCPRRQMKLALRQVQWDGCVARAELFFSPVHAPGTPLLPTKQLK